jgi:hypothetical protein
MVPSPPAPPIRWERVAPTWRGRVRAIAESSLVVLSRACCRNNGARAVPARSSSDSVRSAGFPGGLWSVNGLRPGTGRAPTYPVHLGNTPSSCAPARPAHPDTAAGAPVSDPAPDSDLRAMRRVGDRRSTEQLLKNPGRAGWMRFMETFNLQHWTSIEAMNQAGRCSADW